jgi:type II restriction enzyme
MDLRLDPSAASGYRSHSRIAGVMTERWFEKSMFCPACESDHLKATDTNTQVIDFFCPRCDEKFQLKGLAHPLGNRIVDSAYEPKIKAIRNGTIPNFAFLHYDKENFVVRDLVLLPRYFMRPEIIEKRKPLKQEAKRHGWIGSSIIMDRLPFRAKIFVVYKGIVLQKEEVRDRWSKTFFLRDLPLASKGWLSDVMSCIEELGREEFTLSELYRYKERLAALHPRNRNIEAKIRQQLQLLRDRGLVEFLGKGRYRYIQ